jgi:hypothetical protein
VFHDLRRSVRTGLSRLKIPPHIAEAVINHSTKTALQKTYDKHEFLDEKREALAAWGKHVAQLVADRAGTVTMLRKVSA